MVTHPPSFILVLRKRERPAIVKGQTVATKIFPINPVVLGLIERGGLTEQHIESVLIKRGDAQLDTGLPHGEGPFLDWEVAVEKGRIVATLTGSSMYFDGEIEIMNACALTAMTDIVGPYV